MRCDLMPETYHNAIPPYATPLRKYLALPSLCLASSRYLCFDFEVGQMFMFTAILCALLVQFHSLPFGTVPFRFLLIS